MEDYVELFFNILRLIDYVVGHLLGVRCILVFFDNGKLALAGWLLLLLELLLHAQCLLDDFIRKDVLLDADQILADLRDTLVAR